MLCMNEVLFYSHVLFFPCCRLVAAHILQCIQAGAWVVVAVIWVVEDRALIIEVSHMINYRDCILQTTSGFFQYK